MSLSYKTIAIVLAVILVLGIAGYVALQLHQRQVISHAESLYREGNYKAIIDFLTPQVTPGTDAPEKRLLLGKALYHLGEWDRAQEVLDPLLRFSQEEPEAVVLSGWIWLKMGGDLRAKERFESLERRGFEVQPVMDAGLGAVALVRSERYRRTDLDEAHNLLEKALAADPTLTEAYLYLAEYHLIQHETREAVAQAQKAVNLEPFWAEPYMLLGRCEQLNGEYAKAQRAFETALRYGASEKEANYYLARSLYQQGQFEEALRVFEDLSALKDPVAAKAMEDAAKIYIGMGNIPKAAANLEKAFPLLNKPATALQLYHLYTRLGQTQKADDLLQKIISQWPLSTEAQMEMGNQLLRSGNSKRAYSFYQNVLDDDPQNCLANFNLGWISVAEGQFFQAPDFFDMSSRFYEDFFAGKINYALSLLSVGRDLESQTILQELFFQSPSNPLVLLAQALERFVAGYPEMSLMRIGQALEAKPDQPEPLIIQGEVLLRLFLFDSAKVSFRQALALEPDNLRAMLGLAHVSYRLGEWEQAQELYGDVMNLKGELSASLSTEVRNGNALLLAHNGDLPGAMNAWDTMKNESDLGRQFSIINRVVASGNPASELDLDDLAKGLNDKSPLPEIFYDYAVLCDHLGKTDDAVRTYETVVKAHPSFLPALFNLAMLQFSHRRYEEALSRFDQAEKSAPDRIEILNNRAALESEMGQVAAADERLSEALQKNPGNHVVQTNRVLIALKQANHAEARRRFAAFQKEAGRTYETLMLDGLLQAEEGDWKGAEQVFVSSQKAGDTNPYTAINYGIALAGQARFAEAEEVLSQSVMASPNLAVTHRALGLLYCKIGLFEEALAALRESLRLDPAQPDLERIVEQIQGWMG